MNAKGIIFDLDGTLLDSMPAWEHVGADFLRSLGIAPPDDLDEKVKTMSFEESAQYFIEGCGADMSLAEVLAAINGMVREQYKNTIPLKPFVREVLLRYKARGIKMCVATANDHDLIVHSLERLRVASCFEFILTCAMVGASKRESKIYDVAARQLGIEKSELVVFEDALHCIKVLRQNGYRTVGVYDASCKDDQEEIKRLCDRYIVSFEELLEEER